MIASSRSPMRREMKRASGVGLAVDPACRTENVAERYMIDNEAQVMLARIGDAIVAGQTD